MDDESNAIAHIALSLTRLSYELLIINGVEIGDLADVEMLARKSLRIIDHVWGVNHFFSMLPLLCVSDALSLKEGDHYEERRDLNERTRQGKEHR